MNKVGNKSTSPEAPRRKVGRPKTGHTKEKISVSVDQKVLRASLEKWQNQTTTSGLVELLLRGYADGSIQARPLK